jgi:hypothetical protein
MKVPRSVEEILEQADALATHFENYHPHEDDEVDPRVTAQLRAAVLERSDAERHIVDAIKVARAAGMTWTVIGTFVGTSGEAARQRYSHMVA